MVSLGLTFTPDYILLETKMTHLSLFTSHFEFGGEKKRK